MNSSLSRNQRHLFLLLFILLTVGLAVYTQHATADPRWPVPPMPESPAIWHESFDEYYFAGETNFDILIDGVGLLDQSWSGYQLNRIGAPVVPVIIPGIDFSGHTNISSDTIGALRFWVLPAWTSQSAGGTGPETNAVLAELDASSGGEVALAWDLEISPDGGTLSLVTPSGPGLAVVLESSISWQTNESHSIALDFGTNGSELYVDGQPVAQGSALPSVPPSVAELTLGSAISGSNPAEGDLEEVYSFNYWLTDFDVAAYYGMTSQQAALGPLPPETDNGGFRPNDIHNQGNVYDPRNYSPCSPGGLVYITNVVATPETNGTTTVSFTVQGRNQWRILRFVLQSVAQRKSRRLSMDLDWAGSHLQRLHLLESTCRTKFLCAGTAWPNFYSGV
jgi:hypothetical protein